MGIRDIIFRGKRTDNGEWVEGNLFIPDSDSRPTQILMGTDIVRISYEIDPETVGQYTGLIDKNGKKIFENDIIKDSETGEIFKIFYNWDRFSKTNDSHYFLDLSLRIYECEVIGNIYDNPELLK